MKHGIGGISIGRSDTFRLRPQDIHVKPDWNCRDFNDPENAAHVEWLAKSIAIDGVKEPVTVYWEDGKAWLTNGECRLRGALLAIKNGAELESIPAQTEPRGSDEGDRLFSQILRNSGKSPSPMERGRVYKTLLAMGWTEERIAERQGVSLQTVNNLLDLQGAPLAIKEMISKGKVSPTLATTVIRKSKGKADSATATLQAAVEKAEKDGKPRATAKHVELPAEPAKPASEATVAVGNGDARKGAIRSELDQRILGAIEDAANAAPENGESWESWYHAAFDLLSEKVRSLMSDKTLAA